MEENLFVYVKWFALKDATSQFSVRNVTMKKQ